MTHVLPDRRKEPRKRLANRLLLRVVLVSLALLVSTLFITVTYTYPHAKQDVIADLKNAIAEKVKRNQMALALVEQRAEQLATSYLEDYRVFVDDPALVETYPQWFETRPHPVWIDCEMTFSLA